MEEGYESFIPKEAGSKLPAYISYCPLEGVLAWASSGLEPQNTASQSLILASCLVNHALETIVQGGIGACSRISCAVGSNQKPYGWARHPKICFRSLHGIQPLISSIAQKLMLDTGGNCRELHGG
jgi:hypothetical protein